MTDNKRVPCKKCLLADISYGDELKKIQEMIALMPDKEKTSEEEYERRLAICRECENLSEGTCMQCGCYVELRAAKLSGTCPVKNKWR